VVKELYGDRYLPSGPRRYDKRVKNAQEAHEAIRPAGDTFRLPERSGLSGDQLRLYELIWKRTVASQMADAQGQSVQVRLGATSSSGEDAEFAANGRVVSFPGFLRAYVEGSDDPDAELEDREVRLPPLAPGEALAVEELSPEGHTTQPPARYTEASLVKALEDMGVGRPSTYATIMDTIVRREYVWKKGSALVPTWKAFAVIGLLEQYFSRLVDYRFTAEMEEDLDSIARGDEEPLPWLTRFYFGAPGGEVDGPGLKRMVAEQLGVIDARAINSIPIGGEGSGVVVRVGRYGPYLQEGERTASLPDDLPPDELGLARAREILDAPPPERTDRELGTDPDTGLPVLARDGRYGPYVQLGRPDDVGPKAKPRTSSLLPGMALEDLSLDDALRLLTLPRTVGREPGTDEDVVVDNGRYGPYVRRGTATRSLENVDQLFGITLDEALELLARPGGRQARQAAPPLAQLGDDPVSGRPVVVKEGRFGPYVTDGTVNASLRRGDSVQGLTLERAAELLADRRAKAEADTAAGITSRRGRPGARPAGKSAPGKKAAGKKVAAKKTAAKKTAAKKAVAKKTVAKKTVAKAAAAPVKKTAGVAKSAPAKSGLAKKASAAKKGGPEAG
jgi:DNA topoisomerase I